MNQDYQANVRQLSKQIKELDSKINQLPALNTPQTLQQLFENSMETVSLAERITCQIRSIVQGSGMIDNCNLMKVVAEAQDIRIKEQDKMLIIRIPRIMPKWKNVHSIAFLEDAVLYALSQYYSGHSRIKFRECAVCFVHVYDKSKTRRRVFDHDNMELRSVLNAVSMFFLTDDSGLLCDLYQTSRMGKMDCTMVFVMDKDKLTDFLENIQNHIQFLSEYSD